MSPDIAKCLRGGHLSWLRPTDSALGQTKEQEGTGVRRASLTLLLTSLAGPSSVSAEKSQALQERNAA